MHWGYPILSAETAKKYEASVLLDEAMEWRAIQEAGTRVGRAILRDRSILGRWPDKARILILCGKGHNSADALVAGGLLQSELPGAKFHLVHCRESAPLAPLAERALGEFRQMVGKQLSEHTLGESSLGIIWKSPWELVIDGIYGAGFRAPMNPLVEAAIQAVNANPDIDLRVAIDFPSGMGETPGETVFRADFTYVPGIPKEALFGSGATRHCGRRRFIPMDCFASLPEETPQYWVTEKSFRWLNRLRATDSDKREYGHLMILAGSLNMPGAALMAARGALAGGVGLLTVFAPTPVVGSVAGSLPEAMWQPVPVTAEGSLEQEVAKMATGAAAGIQALLVGPGLRVDKTSLYGVCRIIRESKTPLVLDASGLREDTLAALQGRSPSAGTAILTPHHGEFKRLTGGKGNPEILEDVVGFARKYHLILVLKGNPTIVTDGRRVGFCPVGGPVLARGGSGDILAGLIAGLLARNPESAYEVALTGVVWHGAAADWVARESGEVSVLTTQLIPAFSKVLRAPEID